MRLVSPASPAPAPDARVVPPAVAVEGLTARYGAVTALDRVTLALFPGEILCLVGPSGAGKSTLLRLLAGLERPFAGRILVDGVEVAGPGAFVEAEARRIGMVFQDSALFPHLTVAENVGFGLRGRQRSAAAADVRALLSAVGLVDRAGSYPHMLSGGERQRVALVRALAPRPRVVLMDEPFSGLDGRRRDDVRDQTVAMLRRTGTTAVLVTHDASEALRLGDRVALLEHGRLVQAGTATEIYERPASICAARAFGDTNVFAATCRDGRVHTPLGDFPAAGAGPSETLVSVRPQHVRLSESGPGVSGRVVRATFHGEATDLVVAIGQPAAFVRARVAGAAPFHRNDAVCLSVAPADVQVFVRDTNPARRACECEEATDVQIRDE